ncbi:MAG: DUF885 domain-containing protein [Bacillus sp. (in: Bacteria)]|nr:DUF885 domain-containing protein [Bacillus sp. (in: firmicutes)]
MKKKLSPKQWIGAILLLLLFILFTLFLYSRSHEDSRFETYAEKFFLSELCSNPINLHYTLTNPAAYGIDEKTLTLNAYHAGQALEDLENTRAALNALQKFHPEKMSSANQYTYILLSTYLTAREACASYPYYEEPLSPASGVQAQLPILLANYRISSAEDIESYLSILSQIPAYLSGLILYEQEKADYGLFMSERSANKVIEQCSAFMDAEQLTTDSHFLETTFAERLETLVQENIINESEAKAWQAENKRLLTTVVAPAYNRLADELTLLKAENGSLCGLSHYADGQEYYQAYLRFITGSSHSIPEMKQMLSLDFEKNYTALIRLLQENPGLKDTLSEEDTSFPDLSAENMLSYLQNMIAEDYPAIPLLTLGETPPLCSVKYLDASLAPYSAPAFYLTPPIDDMSKNTIYINGMDTADGLSLFTTLAHEGYPGHLYQTVYSGYHRQLTGVSPLRSILHYGGYVEGWAMYVELNSYDYAIQMTKDAHPETEVIYQIHKLNRQIQLCLYSLLDIIIHYEGASYERVREILSTVGFTNEEDILAVYEYIIEEPCNYPQYYLGYLEIERLKNQAENAWGDSYTLYRFHTFLLNNGPADFRTLSRLLAVTRTGRQPLSLERKN